MRLILAGVAAVVALGAAVGFQREYAVALTMRDTPLRVMEKLSSEAPPKPASWRGIRAVMLGCHSTQSSVALQFQPTALRAAVNAHCADTARAILDRAPTASVAHLVLAMSAAHFADTDALNDQLAKAQATGAREGWLVARRHTLATQNHDALDQGGLDIWSRDTAVLLEERWGREIVAHTFVANVALRPKIEELVALLPNNDQRNFVSLVRQRTQALSAVF
jgi:hypothetical protein